MFLNNLQLGEFEPMEITMGSLGTRTLMQGSKGQDVLELQQVIIQFFRQRNEIALPRFGADGDFGSETREWVIRLQREMNLSADGIVGSSTFNAIKAWQSGQAFQVQIPPQTTQQPVSSTTPHTTQQTQTQVMLPTTQIQTVLPPGHSKSWFSKTGNQVMLVMAIAGIITVGAMMMPKKKGVA
jgi:peptidoglycan hydrolase-like protein with peptidoglycan-binding domain